MSTDPATLMLSQLSTNLTVRSDGHRDFNLESIFGRFDNAYRLNQSVRRSILLIITGPVWRNLD